METKVLKIKGMTCTHCQKAVEDALKEISGVRSVDVNLDGNEATVSYDPGKTSVDAMKSAVEQAGYEVVSA